MQEEKFMDILKRNFSFTEYESKCYVKLIGAFEPLDGNELARRTGISVTKIYSILESLDSKGLIRTLFGRPKKFEVVKPYEDALLNLEERMTEEIRRKQEQELEDKQKLIKSGIKGFLGTLYEKAKLMTHTPALYLDAAMGLQRGIRACNREGKGSILFFIDHDHNEVYNRFVGEFFSSSEKLFYKMIDSLYSEPKIRKLIFMYEDLHIRKLKECVSSKEDHWGVNMMRGFIESAKRVAEGKWKNMRYVPIESKEFGKRYSVFALGCTGDLYTSEEVDWEPDPEHYFCRKDTFKGGFKKIPRMHALTIISVFEKYAKEHPEKNITVILRDIQKEVLPKMKDKALAKRLDSECRDLIKKLGKGKQA